jgi:hypothetical protein
MNAVVYIGMVNLDPKMDPKKRAQLERLGATTRADVEAWLADQDEQAAHPRPRALRRWVQAVVGATVALVGPVARLGMATKQGRLARPEGGACRSTNRELVVIAPLQRILRCGRCSMTKN